MMRSLLRSFSNLILQPNCLLCDRAAREPICPACQRRLQHYQRPDPAAFWQGDLPLWVWGHYAGALKQAIARLKYDNKPELARSLGFWLGASWQSSPPLSSRPVLVPIPMHATKQQQRGFNQAELIARSFGHYTRLRLATGLVRVRATEAMFGLSPAARDRNITDAFQLAADFQRRPPRQPVLLVDDIYTTGATAREAARVLAAAQIPVAGIAAIATTRERP
ncbi:MAG: ComF family protein [Spirulinaceae cyanobacterium SM2_1_0]|nr:ComF family protein [Spirulinaceae cyanobacterium SM2_1_0]